MLFCVIFAIAFYMPMCYNNMEGNKRSLNGGGCSFINKNKEVKQ